MIETIEAVLEGIRRTLQLHAGGVELVDFIEDTGTVRVRLTGTCHGCSLAQFTLKRGVEAALCQALPEVRQVIAI